MRFHINRNIKVLIFVSILFFICFLLYSLHTLQNTNKKLNSDIQTTSTDLKSKNVEIYELWNKIHNLENAANLRDPNSSTRCFEHSDNLISTIVTDDKKYYVGRSPQWGSGICSAESQRVVGEMTGKTSYKNITIFTYLESSTNENRVTSKGLFFILDTKAKTLKYYGSEVLNDPKLRFFIAPLDTDYTAWSDDAKLVKVEASVCYGCMTTPYKYIYNVENGIFSPEK